MSLQTALLCPRAFPVLCTKRDCDKLVTDLCDKLVADLCDKLVTDLFDKLVTDLCDKLVTDLCDKLVTDLCDKLVTDLCAISWQPFPAEVLEPPQRFSGNWSGHLQTEGHRLHSHWYLCFSAASSRCLHPGDAQRNQRQGRLALPEPGDLPHLTIQGHTGGFLLFSH